MVGALQGTILTLVVERNNSEIWALGWDAKLLACAYAVRLSLDSIFSIFTISQKDTIFWPKKTVLLLIPKVCTFLKVAH